MQYIDVFNGDADGLCALVQLRRHTPLESTLMTSTKRDISLLKRINDAKDTHITVLDISFEKNACDVERLLQSGAHINYIDHHQTGEIKRHPNLTTDINLSADICTSLIVDQQLKGQYRGWALAAAFGDNLTDKAMQLGLASGFGMQQLEILQELGTYINYNGYGSHLEDLFFDPARLYQRLVQFDTPFGFLAHDQTTFNTLKTGYLKDMEKAELSLVIHATEHTTAIKLPNEKWARRVSGVYGNALANRHPNKAHAIITDKGNGYYLVSVRAPLNRKFGADTLVHQFPTGGGRKAAAGINALPIDKLDVFIQQFDQQFMLANEHKR